MTSINLPLVDKQLLSVDAALGFDWIGYVGFVNARPWLGTDFLGRIRDDPWHRLR